MNKDAKMYKETKVKLVNPIYAIGLTWLVYALLFPLYRLSDLIIAACISAIAYLAALKFIPEKTVVVPLTGTGALDARCMEIIDKGYGYIGELEKHNKQIPDKAMTAQIDEITAISRQMFDYAAKNPRVATDLRNFIEYYYPTTIKLLGTYSDMREQGMKSQNVGDIMDKVSGIMGTIVTAFRKQLDMMYADKQLDIRTDIEVLKNVLAAEGLSDK